MRLSSRSATTRTAAVATSLTAALLLGPLTASAFAAPGPSAREAADHPVLTATRAASEQAFSFETVLTYRGEPRSVTSGAQNNPESPASSAFIRLSTPSGKTVTETRVVPDANGDGSLIYALLDHDLRAFIENYDYEWGDASGDFGTAFLTAFALAEGSPETAATALDTATKNGDPITVASAPDGSDTYIFDVEGLELQRDGDRSYAGNTEGTDPFPDSATTVTVKADASDVVTSSEVVTTFTGGDSVSERTTYGYEPVDVTAPPAASVLDVDQYTDARYGLVASAYIEHLPKILGKTIRAGQGKWTVKSFAKKAAAVVAKFEDAAEVDAKVVTGRNLVTVSTHDPFHDVTLLAPFRVKKGKVTPSR